MGGFGKRIGLVLSGGGAKGAYQIGVLRALEELGAAGNIRVISGCSIGACNGLCYAAGGTACMRDFMDHFGPLYAAGRETPEEVLAKARADVLRGAVDREEFQRAPRFRRCGTGPLEEYMARLLPDSRLAEYPMEVLVCAYSLEQGRPEYFALRGLPGKEQRKLVLASSSLSFVFPPVAYRGRHYLDGGEVPEICPGGAPEDKIPLGPIAGRDLDTILVSFLIPADTVDRTLVRAGTEYFELRPSRPLEAYPGAGTLDFSREKLRSHEALGYEDTLRCFSR